MTHNTLALVVLGISTACALGTLVMQPTEECDLLFGIGLGCLLGGIVLLC